MRKTLLRFLVLAACTFVVAICSTASASLAQFRGSWKNIDPNTRGITALDVRVLGSSITVEAWGKCHPTDCDWGRVTAYGYAPNVSSNLFASAQALSAVFRTNFSETLMIITSAGENRISAEVFTRFTDNSARTSYQGIYTFTRVPLGVPAPAQISPSNGAVFDNFPRTTTLTWSAVPGAVSYTLEIDCFGCCQSNYWCTDVGRSYTIVHNLTTTNYTFDFVGAQPGRWRVWALDADRQEGAKSGWSEFRYTR